MGLVASLLRPVVQASVNNPAARIFGSVILGAPVNDAQQNDSIYFATLIESLTERKALH